MTDDFRGCVPLPTAVDGLVGELENAEDWLAQLTDELARTQARCDSLLGAVDQALTAMPLVDRRAFYVRVKRLRIMANAPDRNRAGRVSDAVLDILSRKGRMRFQVRDLTNALQKTGFALTGAAVSKRLINLAEKDIVERVAHGRYRPNPDHPELRRRRLTEAREREHAEIRSQIAAMKQHARAEPIE